MSKGANSEFMLVYNIYMGIAHIYAFLPVMLLGNHFSRVSEAESFQRLFFGLFFKSLNIKQIECQMTQNGHQQFPNTTKTVLLICIATCANCTDAIKVCKHICQHRRTTASKEFVWWISERAKPGLQQMHEYEKVMFLYTSSNTKH